MSQPVNVRAMIITPRGEVIVLPYAITLINLQATVGGYIEAITGPTWHAYVNENGVPMNLELNPLATLVIIRGDAHVSMVGGTLRGTVIFLGNASGHGEGDVPRSLVDIAHQLQREHDFPEPTGDQSE